MRGVNGSEMTRSIRVGPCDLWRSTPGPEISWRTVRATYRESSSRYESYYHRYISGWRNPACSNGPHPERVLSQCQFTLLAQRCRKL